MSDQRAKQEELLALLAERSLGFFERRRRRMIAAQNRLEQQGYTLSDIYSLAGDKVRLKADSQLRQDVFCVLNMGFNSDDEMDAAIRQKTGSALGIGGY